MKIDPSRLAEDYHLGMIGNGRTCALVDAFGTIVFCCLPAFDSGTMFASLLDSELGGSFGVEMVDGRVTGQYYEKHTNILVTCFEGKDGAFHLVDFMPRYTSDGRAGARDDIGPVSTTTLGGDILAGHAPQVLVPAGWWQAARPIGGWALVSCVVSPGFEFSGFELAPEGWEPAAG